MAEGDDEVTKDNITYLSGRYFFIVYPLALYAPYNVCIIHQIKVVGFHHHFESGCFVLGIPTKSLRLLSLILYKYQHELME